MHSCNAVVPVVCATRWLHISHQLMRCRRLSPPCRLWTSTVPSGRCLLRIPCRSDKDLAGPRKSARPFLFGPVLFGDSDKRTAPGRSRRSHDADRPPPNGRQSNCLEKKRCRVLVLPPAVGRLDQESEARQMQERPDRADTAPPCGLKAYIRSRPSRDGEYGPRKIQRAPPAWRRGLRRVRDWPALPRPPQGWDS